MRLLILLALIIGGLIMFGVIHVTTTANTYQIEIDKQRLEAVEREAANLGGQFLHGAQNTLSNDPQNQGFAGQQQSFQQQPYPQQPYGQPQQPYAQQPAYGQQPTYTAQPQYAPQQR